MPASRGGLRHDLRASGRLGPPASASSPTRRRGRQSAPPPGHRDREVPPRRHDERRGGADGTSRRPRVRDRPHGPRSSARSMGLLTPGSAPPIACYPPSCSIAVDELAASRRDRVGGPPQHASRRSTATASARQRSPAKLPARATTRSTSAVSVTTGARGAGGRRRCDHLTRPGTVRARRGIGVRFVHERRRRARPGAHRDRSQGRAGPRVRRAPDATVRLIGDGRAEPRHLPRRSVAGRQPSRGRHAGSCPDWRPPRAGGRGRRSPTSKSVGSTDGRVQPAGRPSPKPDRPRGPGCHMPCSISTSRRSMTPRARASSGPAHATSGRLWLASPMRAPASRAGSSATSTQPLVARVRLLPASTGTGRPPTRAAAPPRAPSRGSPRLTRRIRRRPLAPPRRRDAAWRSPGAPRARRARPAGRPGARCRPAAGGTRPPRGPGWATSMVRSRSRYSLPRRG